MWREMTDLSRWKRSAIWLSESQTVSFWKRHWMRVLPSSVW
jgi:hypothetical protein